MQNLGCAMLEIRPEQIDLALAEGNPEASGIAVQEHVQSFQRALLRTGR